LKKFWPVNGRKSFTIISNNCWGTHVYQKLKIEYQTPFIGLFLDPESYLNLISDFRKNVAKPLKFKPASDHFYINKLRQTTNGHYPIGYLSEKIEIQFVHYDSEKEAEEKWNRRVERIAKDDTRLFFKFCDRDGCSFEQLKRFDSLPFKNKVCFVSRPQLEIRCVLFPGLSWKLGVLCFQTSVGNKVCFVSRPQLEILSAVFIPECEEGQVPDGIKLSEISDKFFDENRWLKSGIIAKKDNTMYLACLPAVAF